MALLQAKTEYGMVEGVKANFPFFTVFRGIPFMAPPIGENRWRAPKPAESWEGVRKCDAFPPTAIQPPYSSEGGTGLIASEYYGCEMPMDEDCMYLNIWTPANSPDEKLPVAVYIHGGGFITGYSYLNCYDGEGFNKRGVIFVTIPYRLNIFGFLAHKELTEESEYHASGNYALLDQIEGLKWVKRNIANFGGDPDNISIFGQSAGAMSVHAMCTTPLTKGLFKRAIIQSGGGLGQGMKYPRWTSSLSAAEELGAHFLKECGCKNIAEARAMDAKELLSHFVEFGKKELFPTDKNTGIYANIYMRFMPVDRDGYVFPKSRNDICLEGEHADIQYILGSTKDEWRSMTEGNLAFAENQLVLGRNPAYLYYITYVPPGAEAEGAHHSVEHHYVFQTLLRSNRPYKGFDFELSNELADRWAQFFKTGTPNCKEYIEWTPYTNENKQVLGITGIGRLMQPLTVSDEERENAKKMLIHS